MCMWKNEYKGHSCVFDAQSGCHYEAACISVMLSPRNNIRPEWKRGRGGERGGEGRGEERGREGDEGNREGREGEETRGKVRESKGRWKERSGSLQEMIFHKLVFSNWPIGFDPWVFRYTSLASSMTRFMNSSNPYTDKIWRQWWTPNNTSVAWLVSLKMLASFQPTRMIPSILMLLFPYNQICTRVFCRKSTPTHKDAHTHTRQPILAYIIRLMSVCCNTWTHIHRHQT